MHVLMLTPVYFPFRLPHGGNFFHEHALAVQSQGARVGIVCPELRSISTLLDGSVGRFRFQREICRIDGVYAYKRLGWAIPKRPQWTDRIWMNLARGLARRYVEEQGRPDLIHAHWAVRAGFAARQIAADIGCPYVISEHYTGFARKVLRPWQEAQARIAYADAAAVSAVSRALARIIEPYSGGRQLTVIPNSIRLEDFTLSERIPTEQFTFLTVSNLDSKKRVELLIESFAGEFRGCENVGLRIGGDGPSRASLDALAQRLDVTKQVRFLGRLSRQGVLEAMQGADCFVLPSQFETFGVVVIEAMATGLPVVATASGGPEEIITPASGVVVPVEDSPRLAGAMRAVYLDREKWREAAPEIRAHVERRYATEVVGRELLSFYEQALSAGSSDSGGVVLRGVRPGRAAVPKHPARHIP